MNFSLARLTQTLLKAHGNLGFPSHGKIGKIGTPTIKHKKNIDSLKKVPLKQCQNNDEIKFFLGMGMGRSKQ